MRELSKPSTKTFKKQDPKKASPCLAKEPDSKKQSRKPENPKRILSAVNDQNLTPSICQNAACRAFMSFNATFCRRCSCCICHSFDDNKDPTLWLVCSTESEKDSCGLSCHIECALKKRTVGVSDLGQLMQLDGSYCCVSCGKVSGILGCWKKQLIVAKDARRLDILCHRILLSYRLLAGTCRFKELLEIVTEAKTKVEAEVGPLNGFSTTAHGIVSRLSVADDVQKLCSLGVERAEQWMAKHSDCLGPTTPLILFEEIRPSSVIVILIGPSSHSSNHITGYKLWYRKSNEDSFSEKPDLLLGRNQRRFLISNLQPSTDYTFRVVSYTETGGFGRAEANCSTRSLARKKENEIRVSQTQARPETGLKSEKSFGLDLNVASVPDLNEEIPSGPAVDLRMVRAPGMREDPHDCDSTLINGSPTPLSNGLGCSDESFEYCVKTVRRLECGGHIGRDFRLKFLTWFSLRAADQERRVVNSFVRAMVDDPSCLAGQLIDSFSEIISSKKLKNNGFAN